MLFRSVFSLAFSRYYGEQQSLDVYRKYGTAIGAVRDCLEVAKGANIDIICAIYMILLVQASIPTTANSRAVLTRYYFRLGSDDQVSRLSAMKRA